MKTHEQHIEALLFYKNEPVSYEWIAKTLGKKISEIREIIGAMQVHYTDRGIQLVTTDEEVSLVTSAPARAVVEKLVTSKEEKELSKQALETLAIIAYKGRITKPEIDYIRGVNSVFILRNLLIRGLIIKKQHSSDKRVMWYLPSHDLFSYLGMNSLEALPEFRSLTRSLNELQQEFVDSREKDDDAVSFVAQPENL